MFMAYFSALAAFDKLKWRTTPLLWSIQIDTPEFLCDYTPVCLCILSTGKIASSAIIS